MRKYILILLVPFFLTGCDTLCKKEVVKDNVYVVRMPSKDLLTIPEQVKPLDTKKASQADVAQWIVQNEMRTLQLENQIIGIYEFLTKEQNKSDNK